MARFDWVLYVFGGFLIVTGARLLRQKPEASHPELNPIVRMARSILPIAADAGPATEPSFFVRRNGRPQTTLLFLVSVVVEAADLALALDSRRLCCDSRSVYTSNVFAVLGMRSLYFVLAGVITRLRYLRVGLAVILTFVGAKMLLAYFYKPAV